MEVSVAAVDCTVEENVMKDAVSGFLVREHQVDRKLDGWPAPEEEIVASTGVKSVDDGEAWPPEFAKYRASTVAEAVDTSVAVCC